MKLFLQAMLTIFGLAACTTDDIAAVPEVSVLPANVVLIFVDDLGYCDSELYGCDDIPTPHIRSLAEDGTVFIAGYVTSPVCSPSRASLLTGRYQQRFGHEFLPEADPTGQSGLPIGESTLADAMRSAGYTTGMVGKWHLGDKDVFHPLNRGFDHFFGVLTSATDYIDPTRADVKSASYSKKTHTFELSNPSDWRGRGKNFVARGNVPVDEGDYITDAFTREARAFIRENKDAPFFLYLPYNAPHGPLQVTQEYYDRFPKMENEAKRIYAAMISALDDSIGAVLGVIEEQGLEDNTLVILISDNGGGVAAHANNSPFRLGKHTLFEGGVRVPFVMKWPDHISAGGTYEHPVSTLDVFPTAVAAARSTKTPTKELDGVDLIPILQNDDNPPPHEALFWRNGANWAVREGDWKLIYAAERHWLYDLSSDVGEKYNVSHAHPDIIERLTIHYKEWNKGNIEPLWPPLAVKGQPRFAVDGVNIKWAL